MPWTKKSDDFADECWALSDAAYRLHDEGLIWSNKKLLDCRIPKDDLRRFKRPEALPELLEIGFWFEEGDVYVIRHHSGHQRARVDVLAQQEANQRNGRRGGRPRKPRPDDDDSQTQSHTDSVTHLADRRGRAETEPLSESPTDGLFETDSVTQSPSDSKTKRDRTTSCPPEDSSSSGGGSGGKPRKRENPVGIREDWRPLDRHFRFAHEHNLDIERERRRFVRWNQGKDKRRTTVGFNQAFDNWLDKADEYLAQQRQERDAKASGGHTHWSDQAAPYQGD